MPAKIHNLHAIHVDTNLIMVGWDQPRDPYSKMEEYHVQYYIKGQESNTSRDAYTTKLNTTVTNLKLKTQYIFKVSLT